MRVFEHDTLAQRVLFGSGRAGANLVAEVKRLGAKSVMVIASELEAEIAANVVRGIAVALHYDDVAPHVPIDKAEKARTAAVDNNIDLLVSVGGGSTTGLAKAIALKLDIPIVAVPTTYAGSEATNVWGLTEAARKTTGVDKRVLPVAVIYDATLTLSLPIDLTVASGMNALAHCVDSMWAPRADPINAAFATEGIRTLATSLPAVKMNSQNLGAREDCLYAAYMSAVAFASAGSGMHHKICHVLGGAYTLPHAETHAIVLPLVLAFNEEAAPDAELRIANAFGTATARLGLNQLREELEAPVALREYGFAEGDISDAVRLILPMIPRSNPRTVTPENLEDLLRAAWAGEIPS